MTAAGGQIWSGWGSGEFSQEAIWAKTMTPLITSGQDRGQLQPADVADRHQEPGPGDGLHGQVTASSRAPSPGRGRCGGAHQRAAAARVRRSAPGYVFVAPYAVLTLAFGVGPADLCDLRCR